MVKKTGEDGIERLVLSEEPFDSVFEQSKAYIYIKITLSDPVTFVFLQLQLLLFSLNLSLKMWSL